MNHNLGEGCDRCNDDVTIDCMDCEQHQDRITELTVHGTNGVISQDEHDELQQLLGMRK